MKRFTKILLAAAAIMFLFYFGMLIADRHALRTQIIRMHVVADSDSYEDQNAKLAVRDAVMQYLNIKLEDVDTVSTARETIRKELKALEQLANKTLRDMESEDIAVVSLIQEEFGKREYETFSLPAGMYESLRIQIGSGEGKNWWCVVFPAFCIPDTMESFESAAVSSGFDQGLVSTLSNDKPYEFRFFLLDCFGKLENLLNISSK